MDWGYINARMRGMKSRLLDHHTLDTLILQPDLDSLISESEKTAYREDLVEARGRYSGMPAIEHALRNNFVRTFRKVLGFSKEKEAEKYISIFLHRWDVQNIKTVLRGKNIHVTSEEILDCLVPAGELDEATLTELVRQQDMKAVIDLLATWRIPYATPLTTAFPEFAKTKDLAVLECALDRYYYEDALLAVRACSPNNAMIREILSLEIDVVNIKTALRMIRDRVEPGEAKKFLLGGGLELTPSISTACSASRRSRMPLQCSRPRDTGSSPAYLRPLCGPRRSPLSKNSWSGTLSRWESGRSLAIP